MIQARRGQRVSWRCIGVAALLISGGSFVGEVRPASASAPANDDFADAQVISGASGTVNGWHVNATSEPGEPTLRVALGCRSGTGTRHPQMWC